MDTEVLIVGGGLSGLYAAYRLAQQDVEFQLLEARDRLGGRICGAAYPGDARPALYDLGPAWVWPDFQPRIARLIRELDLSVFEQFLHGDMLHEQAAGDLVTRSSGPSPMRGSYRVSGGTQALVTALTERLPANHVRLSSPLHRLRQRDGRIEAHRGDGSAAAVLASRVLLALPPRLIAGTMAFEPPLPEPLRRELVSAPTWMAGHAKIVALYDRPFWREQGLSGEAFSRRGPMTEIHDASPVHGGPFALFGFVGHAPGERRSIGEAALLSTALAQLQRLFGAPAATPLATFVKDWARDPYTATELDLAPLGHHPEYGPPQQAIGSWSGQLHLAGSEFAAAHGGYLEGALEAVDGILQTLRGIPGQGEDRIPGR